MTSVKAIAISALTIVGVLVLIALKDVTSAVGLPIIVAFAGVHVGIATTANSTPTTSTPATSTTTATPISNS